MTTLDFELEIGPGVAGSYPVTARAPGGEVAITLRWSLTPAELAHQLAVIKEGQGAGVLGGGVARPPRTNSPYGSWASGSWAWSPARVTSTRWTPGRSSLADDPPYTATSLLLLGRHKEAVEAARRVIAPFYGSCAGEGRGEHPSGFARTQGHVMIT